MSIKILNKEKYVEIDTDQDLFKGKTRKEQIKIAKKYILDNFKGKELIVGQNHALVTRKSANEYTYSKIHANLTSKMKAATELDNLLKISKYKYSKPDDGRHNFAKDGWEYYETKFKICNNMYTGLINIAKNNNKRIFYDITKIKRNT